jgi:Arc/MetJ-type ribon-helix-helix transcriptional regulator
VKYVKKQPQVALNVRVPKTLKSLMQEFVDRDTHRDISELTREAIREKIKREAPNLYTKVFVEEKRTDPKAETMVSKIPEVS